MAKKQTLLVVDQRLKTYHSDAPNSSGAEIFHILAVRNAEMAVDMVAREQPAGLFGNKPGRRN